MELREEVLQIRRQGYEQAAVIWETLENLSQPILPINIYKTACSTKCAEFLSRLRNNIVLTVIMRPLSEFLDGTMKIASDFTGSDKDEGMRAIAVFEEAMPLTDKVFANAVAYAQRQHTYDAIIMLAAVKMGKEEETKQCIDRMQMGVAKAMTLAMFARSLTNNSKENPPVAGWVEPDNE